MKSSICQPREVFTGNTVEFKGQSLDGGSVSKNCCISTSLGKLKLPRVMQALGYTSSHTGQGGHQMQSPFCWVNPMSFCSTASNIVLMSTKAVLVDFGLAVQMTEEVYTPQDMRGTEVRASNAKNMELCVCRGSLVWFVVLLLGILV